jgi:hypothetical protein
MQMVYTYELEYTPRKFMTFPSLEETNTFWKEQNKKGINIKFLYYPIHISIKGGSLEECNIKFKKLREEIFLHNPDIDAFSNMTWKQLRKLYKGD